METRQRQIGLSMPLGKAREFKKRLSDIFTEHGMMDWSSEFMYLFAGFLKTALNEIEDEKSVKIHEPESGEIEKPGPTSNIEMMFIKTLVDYYAGPMLRVTQNETRKRKRHKI